MEFLALALILALVIGYALLRSTKTVADRQDRPPRKVMPAGNQLRRRAQQEAETFNERERRSARNENRWDDRAWIHPDDWARMRSPILVLKHIARADGLVSPHEQAALEGWTEWRLKNSHWGASYAAPKRLALTQLCAELNPADDEFKLALQEIEKTFSNKQNKKFKEIALTLSGQGYIETDEALSATFRALDRALSKSS